MATKKTTRNTQKKVTLKARFNSNRNKFILLGVAIALLVGGLGYNLLSQSEAATGRGCSGSTLRVGSSGNCVRTLQRIVGAGVDGRFGSQTKTKVQSYQRRVNVGADGVVGRNTWSAICRDFNGTSRHLAYLAGTVGCERARGVGNSYYYR